MNFRIKTYLPLFFFVSLVLASQVFAQDKTNSDTTKSKAHQMMKEINQTDSTKIAAEKKIWNKICPVMGNEVDPETITVEYNGKIIGFCCPGCVKKFNKEPDKYIKNLNEDGTKYLGK